MSRKKLLLISILLLPIIVLGQDNFAVFDTIIENRHAKSQLRVQVKGPESIPVIKKHVRKHLLKNRIAQPKFTSKNPTISWQIKVKRRDTVIISCSFENKRSSINDHNGNIKVNYFISAFGPGKSLNKSFNSEEPFEFNYYSIKEMIDAKEQGNWEGNKLSLSINGLSYKNTSKRRSKDEKPLEFPYLHIYFISE